MSCKDCVKRYLACHDTCKEYLEHKQQCIEKNIARNRCNMFCRNDEIPRKKSMWSTHKYREVSMAKTIDELANEIFDNSKKTDKQMYSAPKKAISSSLNLISETRIYKGGFGTYTVSNKVAEIMLDAKPSALDKRTLSDLVQELTELGGLIK